MRRGERLLTFYPRTAIFAKVDGVEDAVAQLEWFRDLCLRTWERRHTITPSYQPKSMLGPLDIYRLLPQSNCKRCGEATCMAFAVAILQGRRTLNDCPPLAGQSFQEARRRLAELLGGSAG
ncbi:MAG: (Fe-S)-binding protein [Anaerolineae bacterium]